MGHLLLLLFVAIPLVELYFLIQVGSVIGALPTIALCVLTAAIGAALIRAQGFSTLGRAQASLDRGEVPAIPMLEGAVLLVSGALLLTPGIVTDILGFACLIPPLRQHFIRRFLERRSQSLRDGDTVTVRTVRGSARRTIEGEFRREDD